LRLPNPKWKWDSEVANIEMGNEVKMHHATLKLHGIAVLYLPYAEHPVDFGRKSGFLIPEVGDSSIKASSWRRLLLGAEPKHRRHAGGDALRGARLGPVGGLPLLGYNYGLQAAYYGVIDEKGAPVTHQNQGGEDLRVNGWKDLPTAFVA